MSMSEARESLYAVLGVASKATQEEIQAAFKKRAKELHPDVNKAPDAEENFKKLVAAYEVLKDEDKRKRYDQFGVNGAGSGASARRARAQRQKSASGASGAGAGSRERPPGFEDFGFGASFGAGFADGGVPGSGSNPFDYILRRQQKKPKREREVQLSIPLEQAYNGTTLSITLEAPGTKETQRFKIKIPQGAKEGDRLKIKDPNIVVVLHIEPHPKFDLDGRDITTTLDVAPWESVLGTDVMVATPGAAVKLKIPPGTSSGQKLRLRGQGLPVKPGKEGEPGDLLVRIRIVVPKNISEKEKELWRELQKTASFDPRSSES